jgi:hypothetical protein
MSELIKDNELQRHGLTADDLKNKFRAQLLKDFEMCSVDGYLEPIVDFSYEAIHANLSKALKEIMESASLNYLHLLYRIDISERHLKEKIRAEPERTDYDVLAELVIKRILQKVILKKIYSE